MNKILVRVRRGLAAGILALLGVAASLNAVAQPAPSTNSNPNPWLDYWSFEDTNTWETALGYPAVSFTNLAVWVVGDGNAVVVDDSTNAAWLQYNVWEADGTTNLTVDVGSVAMWFAPSSWSSQDQGGTGPQCWAPLIETGAYTTNAAYGWWGLSIDPSGSNILFSAQDGNGNETNYITAPFSWTSNLFHCVALTYCSTNTALYIDGNFVTNGPGVTIFPSSDVLSNGFWLGSDWTGSNQCHGIVGDISTYNYPLDDGTIDGVFVLYEAFYLLNPVIELALPMGTPSSTLYSPVYDIISGPGNLQVIGTNEAGCVSNSNVWMTNMSVAPGTNNSVNLTFMVGGGNPDWPYDVFATGNCLISNSVWAWEGQAYPCQTNVLLGLTNRAVYLLLGTPLSYDGDGFTVAYESLILHINPNDPDLAGDGIANGFKYLAGLSLTNPVSFPSLNGVTIPTCPVQ